MNLCRYIVFLVRSWCYFVNILLLRLVHPAMDTKSFYSKYKVMLDDRCKKKTPPNEPLNPTLEL